MEPTLKVVGGHKSQDHEYDAHAGARCVSCGRARFMNALRLRTGACVGMAALRVMACAYLSSLGDRSWFGTMACWFKLVALGVPLASTAGHAMRHEPFLFPPTRPFKGVLRGDGTPGFTEVPYFGVLVPWVRIRRWRRPTRTQAACTAGALLACSIPDPPPAARAHHCDRGLLG